MVNFRDAYDLTPREREVVEDRARRRLQLRNEYLKKYHNPFKPVNGTLFEAPIQRLMSLRHTRREFFKPTALNFVWHALMIFGPMVLFGAVVKKDRETLEHQYRTGQIAYKDRSNKFA